jgi:hypothetical protein
LLDFIQNRPSGGLALAHFSVSKALKWYKTGEIRSNYPEERITPLREWYKT